MSASYVIGKLAQLLKLLFYFFMPSRIGEVSSDLLLGSCLVFKRRSFSSHLCNPTGGLIILNIFLPLSVVKSLLSIRVSNDCLNNYSCH